MTVTVLMRRIERFPIFFVAIGVFLSCLFCFADEYVESKSPDGKFALDVTRGDKQPFPQSDTLIFRPR
jgi:hypothetical protein